MSTSSRMLGVACSLAWITSVAVAEESRTASAATGSPAVAKSAVQAGAEDAGAAGPKEAAPKVFPPSTTALKIGPEEHARLLKEAVSRLSGADPVGIQEALQTLGTLSGRAAAEAVVGRLKLGLPPQLAGQALDVLGALNQPLATPLLVELTQHRRWQIRQKAVAALGALRVRSTVSVLLFTLDDPSPDVRAEAALALGNLGDPRALSALTAALDRNVDGALIAIAKLGSSKQVDFLLARSKADLKAAEPALWTWLSRTNVPVATKVKVVRTLDEWNTEEAQTVLASWQGRIRGGEGEARLLSAFKQPAAAQGATP